MTPMCDHPRAAPAPGARPILSFLISTNNYPSTLERGNIVSSSVNIMPFGVEAPLIFLPWRQFCRDYAPVAAHWSIAHVPKAISVRRRACAGPVTAWRGPVISAFIMKDADYLIKTWHPSCQAQQFRAELEKGVFPDRMAGLNPVRPVMRSELQMKVLSALSPPALMTITAPAPLLNVPDSSKENGQWYYIDGTRPLIGRNNPAPAAQVKNLKNAAASNAGVALANITGFSSRCDSLQRRSTTHYLP